MTLVSRIVDGKIFLNRTFEVSCGARKVFEAGFDESVIAMPWSVEIHSPCGAWRYTLVDSEKVKQPARGVGLLPPAFNQSH
jgi:hypothetical protein